MKLKAKLGQRITTDWFTNVLLTCSESRSMQMALCRIHVSIDCRAQKDGGLF